MKDHELGGPEVPPVCDHHWVSSHQSDFPPEIHWVRYCSQCRRIDGADLTEQVAQLATPATAEARVAIGDAPEVIGRLDRAAAELAAAREKMQTLETLCRDAYAGYQRLRPAAVMSVLLGVPEETLIPPRSSRTG